MDSSETGVEPYHEPGEAPLLERLFHSIDSIVRERYDPLATLHVYWGPWASRSGIDAHEIVAFELDIESSLRMELADGPAHETIYRKVDLELVKKAWVQERTGVRRTLHRENDGF